MFKTKLKKIDTVVFFQNGYLSSSVFLHRSSVSNVAAANFFTKDHLAIPENRELMEKAHYFYIAVRSILGLDAIPTVLIHSVHEHYNHWLMFMGFQSEVPCYNYLCVCPIIYVHHYLPISIYIKHCVV
jgi:hypothetical protein